MRTEIKIHITEDDLSEAIRQKINALRKQGAVVDIVWPKNHVEWPYITPTFPSQWELGSPYIATNGHTDFDDTKILY